MSFINELYLNLKPYTPGEQLNDKNYIKLNTNENPYGVSEKAKKYAEGKDTHKGTPIVRLGSLLGIGLDPIKVAFFVNLCIETTFTKLERGQIGFGAGTFKQAKQLRLVSDH